MSTHVDFWGQGLCKFKRAFSPLHHPYFPVKCVHGLELHNACGAKSTCKFMDFILVVPQVNVYSNSGCVLLCVILQQSMTGTAYTVFFFNYYIRAVENHAKDTEKALLCMSLV